MPAPHTGSCICGALRYVLNDEPVKFPRDVAQFETQPGPGVLAKLWQDRVTRWTGISA